MSERVAIVQAFAHTLRLLLVGSNDLRLEHHTAHDRFLRDAHIMRGERSCIIAEPEEELIRIDHRRFRDLRATARPFPFGQRCKGGKICADKKRLAKGSDQILPCLKVDCGLSSDRRIDHGEQRGGNLHNRQAAHERRTREACQIAHDPSSECDDERIAIELAISHRVPDLGCTFDRFRVLASRDREHERAIGCRFERSFHRLKIMRCNGRVGDDERLGVLIECAECGTEPLDRSRSDAHVIGLMAAISTMTLLMGFFFDHDAFSEQLLCDLASKIDYLASFGIDRIMRCSLILRNALDDGLACCFQVLEHRT